MRYRDRTGGVLAQRGTLVMARNDHKRALCDLIARVQGGGRGLGPFGATAGGGGLTVNTGGGGAFLRDGDVAALEAGGYIVVSRDRRGDGRVTVLKRAVDECGGARR